MSAGNSLSLIDEIVSKAAIEMALKYKPNICFRNEISAGVTQNDLSLQRWLKNNTFMIIWKYYMDNNYYPCNTFK